MQLWGASEAALGDEGTAASLSVVGFGSERGGNFAGSERLAARKKCRCAPASVRGGHRMKLAESMYFQCMDRIYPMPSVTDCVCHGRGTFSPFIAGKRWTVGLRGAQSMGEGLFSPAGHLTVI